MVISLLQRQHVVALIPLTHRLGLRHASKAARQSNKKTNKSSASKNAGARNAERDRIARIASTSSAVTNSSHANTTAVDGAETRSELPSRGIPALNAQERVIYTLDDNQPIMSARLLWGFGFVFFLMCANGADIVRREPRQPADPTAPRIEVWPAWKRWGAAIGIFTAGSAIAAYCVYWPTRILKRITLLPPKDNTGVMWPTNQLARGNIFLTPYRKCRVSFTTSASELAPRLFNAPTVEFEKLRLLGPLSSQQKWYHPQGSAAFSEKASKNGKMPSNVPIAIQGTRISYNLRKAGGTFRDMEGFERALLMNDTQTRVENPDIIYSKQEEQWRKEGLTVPSSAFAQ